MTEAGIGTNQDGANQNVGLQETVEIETPTLEAPEAPEAPNAGEQTVEETATEAGVYSFDQIIERLKAALPSVPDRSFAWNDVIGVIVLKLSNTDSLNKDNDASNATQIQVTAAREPGQDRITEDFFPTLTLNRTFKSWRIAVPVRVNVRNCVQLGAENLDESKTWLPDTIQIRRRILNEREGVPGNPNLQLCYGDDLKPLRSVLQVNDYLVVVKLKKTLTYVAFGVKNNVDLGTGKKMYLAPRADRDDTVFPLDMVQYEQVLDANRLKGGKNVLLYGVPGAGKSWTIGNYYCDDESRMERLVFHPDYTHSDFIGQILPNVKEGLVTYEFTEGPFTKLLRKAYLHPTEEFFLIIEEINRGNAPAIFGEVFQLLDREDDGTSSYSVSNEDVAKKVYGDPNHMIRIPSNMSIIGTMNTSDQNVFTLDTAFQRRWDMRLIKNSFDGHAYATRKILDTDVEWKEFVEAINKEIVRKNRQMTSSEDKRLGTYFIREADLIFDEREDTLPQTEENKKAWTEAFLNNHRFAEKVIKYLWDDAFKFSRDDLFKPNFFSLEEVIDFFNENRKRERFRILNDEIYDALYAAVNQREADEAAQTAAQAPTDTQQPATENTQGDDAQ